MKLSSPLAALLLASVAFAGPADTVRAALADCQRLPPDVQQQAQYLDLSAIPLDRREQAVKVIAFWANSLSRSPDLVAPAVVRTGSVREVVAELIATYASLFSSSSAKISTVELLRFHRIDYGWKRQTWEKLANHDPYFHVQVTEQWPGGYDARFGKAFPAGTYTVPVAGSWIPAREWAALVTATGSQAPVVRADWWFVQTVRQLSLGNQQRGIGYYDWLGVKDRKDFERLIRLSADDSRDLGKEMRAAVDRSGVATHNRQIVRLQALTGGAWSTLDTDTSEGKGNAVRNLKVGTFAHKAEEHYGVLPNGLFCFLLCDAGGDLQPSAPDFIGPDDSVHRVGRDGRIHVGLGCVRCHVEGLRPINDWARRQAKAVASPVYAELVELRRQYFSNLGKQLASDRRLYEEALLECNGMKPAEVAKAVAEFWNAYVEAPVTRAQAAAELGVAAGSLGPTLARSPDPLLSGLGADPEVPVRREHWEEMYGTVAGQLIRGK